MSSEDPEKNDNRHTEPDDAEATREYSPSQSPNIRPRKDDELTRTHSRLDGPGLIPRFLSAVRTKDFPLPQGPPPDGGSRAWGHVLVLHFVIFVTWGNINSFGVFQSYYTTALNEPPSAVAWIGSMQIFLTFFIGTFSGRALDAGFYKLTFCIGTFFQAFGIFMTSICRSYWQIFLAQGLCQGLGNGLVFVPSVALVSTYFLKKRSVALGLTAAGSGTGGLVFPAIIEQLLPKIGFGWTVRVIGLVVVTIMLCTAVYTRPRLPPRKTGPIVEWSAFNEGTYLLFAIGAFLYFWGLYTGFYYVTSYARTQLGVSYADSINILLLMNGVGLPSRVLPGWIADRYTGPVNAFIPAGMISALMVYCWIAVHSVTGIWLFAAFYGAAAGAIQGLFPAALSSLTKDQTKAGVRLGMIFSIVGFATLTGPPIAGALISKDNGRYLYSQIYSGTSILMGSCFLLGARYAMVGWKLREKL